jgi:hypothetical protein
MKSTKTRKRQIAAKIPACVPPSVREQNTARNKVKAEDY